MDIDIFGELSEILNYPGSSAAKKTQAGTTEANFRARTRLSAPIKRVSSPSVEAKTGVEGRPRQIVFSASVLRSSSDMSGQTRAMSPARITASGLNPFVRFEIPKPR